MDEGEGIAIWENGEILLLDLGEKFQFPGYQLKERDIFTSLPQSPASAHSFLARPKRDLSEPMFPLWAGLLHLKSRTTGSMFPLPLPACGPHNRITAPRRACRESQTYGQESKRRTQERKPLPLSLTVQKGSHEGDTQVPLQRMSCCPRRRKIIAEAT